MMSWDIAHRIADNLFADMEAGDSLTLAFQGGEPTLAGIAFFKEIFDYVSNKAKEQNIRSNYALQTNGTIIDESWIPLFKNHPVLIGLSIDGYKQLHDINRKDSAGKDTYNKIMRTKRLLDTHDIPYNVLMTLTNQGARHPQKLWQFLLKEKINYVQFTPCLDSLGGEGKSVFALEPEWFYRFYSVLYPLWAAELEKGHYISVKLFDDLVNYFGKGIPSACGINGVCGCQYVCEGDGSAFPCDFYMLDEYKLGSLAENKPGELKNASLSFVSFDKEYISAEPCKSCRYLAVCHGGCKRMKNIIYLSEGICYYAKLLDEILTPLLNAAMRFGTNRNIQR